MDERIVEDLLKKTGEDSTVDFKSEPYRLDNDYFKAHFIKDVVSLANTPREGSAYILLGIRAHRDGRKDVLGVSDHPDDAELQQLIASNVEPIPNFIYRPVPHGSTTLGVLEIFPRRRGRPFVSTWKKNDVQNVLRYGVVYFRHGSSNSEARGADLEAINRWMLEQDDLPQPPHVEPQIEHWDELFEATHRFSDGWLYVLVTSPEATISSNQLSALGRVGWSLVVDFDPKTHTEGAYNSAKDQLQNRRSVHLLTLEELVPVYPERASYWIAASGLEDRPSTLTGEGWQEWNRKNSRNLSEVIERFARSTSGSPVTVVVVASGSPWQARIVCQQFDSALGDAVEFVFADTQGLLSPVATDFRTSVIPISLKNICAGLSQTLPGSSASLQETTLPTFERGQVAIPSERLRWLEEELEVIHSAVGVTEPDQDRASGRSFLKGATVSWFDLNMHYDVERDKGSRLREQIEKDIQARASRTINLYHWPGAGGTTLARRVAWDLHRTYPVVCLRTGGSQYTLGRLRTIFDLTRLPLVVVVEAADVPAGTVEMLQSEASANHLPVVLLNVQRSFGSSMEGDRVIHLGRTLSMPEAYRFAERLAHEAPERRPNLWRLVEQGQPPERTLFYFALMAFDREFINLETYVKRRVETLGTEVQKRILTFLALAYHYGQRLVPDQLFAELLGIPSNKVVQLERVMPASVVGDLIVRDGPRRWRPVHDLVAGEIIEQVLAGNEADRRVWAQNLSTWSKDFAQICEERPGVPNDEVMDILRRMFVLRDHHQILGTEQSGQPTYTRLVEDIPSQEGRLTLFQELVNLFPTEAHFWAHLGRFYSMSLGDHEGAIQALKRALELDPSDNVLHHMRGMAIRAKAYLTKDDCLKQGCSLSELTTQLVDLVKDAGEEFQRSRELAPQDDHGYISNIQMIISVVETGFRAAKAASYGDFLSSAGAGWYRELLDTSETLLEELGRLKVGQEHPGRYFVQCRANLDQLYGNYARVINGWTGLLGRPGLYQPPIRRQIVRAYLARSERKWDQLRKKELDRIIELLEANLLDEPTRDSNLRLWFQAVRHSESYSLDGVTERLSYWWANSGSLDAAFYLSVVHVVRALDGSKLSAQKAKEFLEETGRLARQLPNRHFSIEWLGKGDGLQRIVHYQLLGSFEEEFEQGTKLALVKGRVTVIRGPEQGWIELESGLRAFFVPSRGHRGDTFMAGRDENALVEFYLAFSYDGLRAWSVRHLVNPSP